MAKNAKKIRVVGDPTKNHDRVKDRRRSDEKVGEREQRRANKARSGS
jgi:hypothetical protein